MTKIRALNKINHRAGEGAFFVQFVINQDYMPKMFDSVFKRDVGYK